MVFRRLKKHGQQVSQVASLLVARPRREAGCLTPVYAALRQWDAAREASLTGFGLSLEVFSQSIMLKVGRPRLQKTLTELLCVSMDINHFYL